MSGLSCIYSKDYDEDGCGSADVVMFEQRIISCSKSMMID